jgi:cytochrome P450
MAVAEPQQRIQRTDLDPYSVDNILRPYELQSALRDLGPIFWLDRCATLAVARYAQVSAVLMDPSRFLSSGGVGLSDIRKPDAWRPSGPIVEVDPPAHTAVRRSMNRIFNLRSVRALQPRFSELARSCCEQAAKRPELDAVRQLIEPYVLDAFSGALGVGLHHENLIIVGNHSFNSSGPKNEIYYASLDRYQKAAEWFEQNQQGEAMRPGGFGEQVFAAEARGDLPPGSASPMLRTLIRGGMDTTISALGTALRLLAEFPEWWAEARRDRSLVLPIFDEAIRLESPVQSVYRTTAEELEFAGLRIPRDTKVQVFIGAANRDPQRFDDAELFNPRRRGAPHAGFGMGPHHCLGQTIARLEAECLLAAMLDRFERIEVASAWEYRPLNVLRTLDHLPIRLIEEQSHA